MENQDSLLFLRRSSVETVGTGGSWGDIIATSCAQHENNTAGHIPAVVTGVLLISAMLFRCVLGLEGNGTDVLLLATEVSRTRMFCVGTERSRGISTAIQSPLLRVSLGVWLASKCTSFCLSREWRCGVTLEPLPRYRRSCVTTITPAQPFHHDLRR